MVKDLNLEKQIIFTGYVKHEILHHYYSNADIFVRTPTDEGFGIVFIEAMASGVPVIATKVGGITDIIHHNKNGIFVPPNDPIKLAKVLNNLLEDEQKRKQLGDSGRDYCLKKYDWDRICTSMLGIYEKIISAR